MLLPRSLARQAIRGRSFLPPILIRRSVYSPVPFFSTTTLCRNSGGRCLLQGIPFTRQFAQFIKPQYWAMQMRVRNYTEEELMAWKDEFATLNGYSLKDLAKWRNAFDLVDKDKDGFISQADLQKNPNFPVERLKLFQEYDLDRNNLIDFGEFVEAMFSVDCTGLRDYFEGFDTVDVQLEFEKYAEAQDDARKHAITLDGINRLMNAHDFTVITDVDARRLLNILDKNGDGVVDFEDLRKWLFPHM